MLFEELCNYLLKLEKTSKRLEMIDILSEVFLKTKKEEINYTVNFIQEQLLPLSLSLRKPLKGYLSSQVFLTSSLI